MKVPCLNCEERHISCHSNCEKYILFKKEKAKENEIIKKNKQHQDDYLAVRENKFKKIKRR